MPELRNRRSAVDQRQIAGKTTASQTDALPLSESIISATAGRLISGLSLASCRQVTNERGYLQEIVRSDGESGFTPGQVYVTCTHQGIVKAWYKHAVQWDTFFVLSGALRMLLVDDRCESDSYQMVNEVILDSETPQLLKLPPGVWHGFKSLSGNLVLLHMNSHPYQFEQTDEVRRDLDTPGMPTF